MTGSTWTRCAPTRGTCSTRVDGLLLRRTSSTCSPSHIGSGPASLACMPPTFTADTYIGDRSGEVYSRLLKERIVFLGTQVDDSSANLICAQLLLLQSEDPDRDIFLYINSPGG